jgi:hypothetical protein
MRKKNADFVKMSVFQQTALASETHLAEGLALSYDERGKCRVVPDRHRGSAQANLTHTGRASNVSYENINEKKQHIDVVNNIIIKGKHCRRMS